MYTSMNLSILARVVVIFVYLHGGLADPNSRQRNYFGNSQLETETSPPVCSCLHTHQVIIITNSDEGWVKYSAEKYCPSLLPVVAKYRVVSARTRYEKFYPGQPLCWKAAAFAHEVNEIYEKLKDDSSSCASLEGTDVSSASSLESLEEEDRRQIISFGDSSEERTAVNIVSGQLDAIPKSVMFMNSPSPAQIIGQLHMLTHHMDYVCDGKSSLDLQISAEQADRFAATYLNLQTDCRA